MSAVIEVNGARATASGFAGPEGRWDTKDADLAQRLRGAMVFFEYSPAMGEPDIAAAEYALRQMGEGELVSIEYSPDPPAGAEQ